MKNRILMTAAAALTLLFPAMAQETAESPDQLRMFTGKLDAHSGAAAEGRIEEGVFTISNTADAGHVIACGSKLLDLTPGRDYEVSCDLEMAEGSSGALMISMPGGKRRPYPQKILTAGGKAVLRFTAREDEKKLALYLVVYRGTVTFRELHVRQLPPLDPTRKIFEGEELVRAWHVENAALDKSGGEALCGLAGPTTRFVSPKLDWNASEVKAVELDASFFPEGSLLELRFTGEANGKTFSSFVRRTAIPSGERRIVTFFFDHQPEWRGKITSIAFRTNIRSRSEFEIYGIRALSEPNLIPHASVPGEKPVEMIHPGADYTLAWRGGRHPEVTVDLLDEDGKKLAACTLGAEERERRFTAPHETVSAVARYESGEGFPVLICDKVPYFGNPQEVRWTAPWIWWGVTNDPIGKVRFVREFTLPAAVKRAEMRYTADDEADGRLNGHPFWKTTEFSTCDRIDVTSMLKKGTNRFVIDVDNHGSAAGLLLELYAELENGETFTLGTDRNWQYVYGDKTGNAVELCMPPQGIWGDRVACAYIGPRTPSEIRNFCETGFEIRPSAAVPDYGRVQVEVVSDTGAVRPMSVEISPRSGTWKANEWNKVSMRFDPGLTAGMPGSTFTLRLVPEFFAAADTVSCVMTPRKAERAEFPTVRLTGAGIRPYFEVNGRKLAPFYFDLPGGFINAPLQKAHFVTNAARAGSNIVRMWYGLRVFWKGPEEFDFSGLDYALAVIRANMPDAHIIFTLRTYMPDWWLEANPGDRIQWFRENKPYHNYFQTMGSLKWIQDAQTGIRALIEHLRASGAADRVIGIAFADGQTAEWIWPAQPYGGGSSPFIHLGNSKADHESFAKFVTEKYGKAPYKPEVPAPDAWNVRDEGIFLDPEKSRIISDYWDFRSYCSSRAIRTFAGLVKKETNRRIMSGAYYGYHVMLSGMYQHYQPGGHLRLHEVVSSGDCELFFAPTLYGYRFPCMPDGIMQPPDAITVNGGIPIMEFDYRTYTEYMPGQLHNGGADTPAMTLSLLDKGFGLAMTRGAGGHWMELHERWFREPLQYGHVGKLLKLYRSLPEKPAGTVTPDVCIVSDEKSALRLTNNVADGVHGALLRETARILPQTGASYRHVLLSDLLTPGKVPAHRFYIFSDLFELDDAQRAALKQRLKEENAHALWFYAPGVLKPGTKVDPAGITEMTGIGVERINEPWTVNWESTEEFGGKTRAAFLVTGLNFRPKDSFDLVVARSGSHPAVVGRNVGGRTDYFSAALVPEERALQEMFRRAGVRLYQSGQDILHAGNDILVFHAISAGEKELLLPEGMYAEQILGPKVSFDPSKPVWQAKAGMTYVFIVKKQ